MTFIRVGKYRRELVPSSAFFSSGGRSDLLFVRLEEVFGEKPVHDGRLLFVPKCKLCGETLTSRSELPVVSCLLSRVDIRVEQFVC